MVSWYFSHASLSSPNAVTYQAELHGTLEATVPDLIGDIIEWLSSGASISVQLQRLTIDSSCSVAISFFNENECMGQQQMDHPLVQWLELPLESLLP